MMALVTKPYIEPLFFPFKQRLWRLGALCSAWPRAQLATLSMGVGSQCW